MCRDVAAFLSERWLATRLDIKQRRCAEGDREAVSRRRPALLEHHGDGAKRFLFFPRAPRTARRAIHRAGYRDYILHKRLYVFNILH